ncbi:ankyrin repeat-containing domain protein [Mycena vitilis]|nr:ankyrin repeat-containing domain protein [Mycena vitilis]
MADPLSIAGAIVTFRELAIGIKESIEKVGKNKENLAELEKEVQDTVKELKNLAQGHGDEEFTRASELLTALTNLTEFMNVRALYSQLETIEIKCQSLTQSKFKNVGLFMTLLQRIPNAQVISYWPSHDWNGTPFEAKQQPLEPGHNSTRQLGLSREEELRKWLQPLDVVMKEKQLATYEDRHGNTGSWLLKGIKFREWKARPRCLWIRGNAINDLLDGELATPNVATAYFYFDFRDKEKQPVRTMLRTMIMQLSEQCAPPHSVLNQHFESRAKPILPNHPKLLTMFAAILSQFAGAYIVLDALDECSEPDKLVHFISTLRGWDKPVHLLVAILAKLPSDLFGIYARFLKPIGRSDFVHVRRLLCWLAFSARPLTKRELDDALAIEFSAPDQWVFQRKKRGRVEVVCDLLEGLVVVGSAVTSNVKFGSESHSLSGSRRKSILDSTSEADSKVEDPLISLAHSSVADYPASEEFFEEYKHDLRKVASHTLLAQSCVAYLRHLEDSPLEAATLMHYPLARTRPYICLNKDINNRRSNKEARTSHANTSNALQVAFCKGHAEVVQFLLDRGADVNAAGEEALSALQCAGRHGHVDTVRILLNRGADVNAVGEECGSALQSRERSALQYAAWTGDADMARFLLEHGANVDNKSSGSGSALQEAARYGHADIVCVLIDHSAGVNAAGGDFGSALQCAALGGHEDVVRLLLEHGADANAAEGEFGSVVQCAAGGGFVDIVRVLLVHGADVNAAGGEVGSALQYAAWAGDVDMVRFLLENGADVNAVGGTFGTALQAASRRGFMEIVRHLNQHG